MNKNFEIIAKAQGWTQIANGCGCPSKPNHNRVVALPNYNDLEIIQDAAIQVFDASDKAKYFCDKLKIACCESTLWPTYDVPDYILIRARSQHWIKAFVEALPYIKSLKNENIN